MREQNYQLTKDGKEFYIKSDTSSTPSKLMATTHAKRLVNASTKFVLTTICIQEIPKKVENKKTQSQSSTRTKTTKKKNSRKERNKKSKKCQKVQQSQGYQIIHELE